MKSFHISIHPRMILAVHKEVGTPYADLLEGGLPAGATEADVEAQLLEDIKVGKVYVLGPCDNLGPNGQCMGHERLEVPDRAYIIHPGPENEPQVWTRVIRVDKGTKGYFLVRAYQDPDAAQQAADNMNGGRLDPRVAEACLVGSMFGWEVPGADPNNYTIENGLAVAKPKEA